MTVVKQKSKKTYKDISVGTGIPTKTIERINNHFMTTFDDATFAAAYRFLEMKGRRHVIKTHRVVRNEDTIDELESKYTKMGQ